MLVWPGHCRNAAIAVWPLFTINILPWQPDGRCDAAAAIALPRNHSKHLLSLLSLLLLTAWRGQHRPTTSTRKRADKTLHSFSVVWSTRRIRRLQQPAYLYFNRLLSLHAFRQPLSRGLSTRLSVASIKHRAAQSPSPCTLATPGNSMF